MTIDKSRIRRILVRATNWVGDVVMMLPALEAVRDIFPASAITVLARPWVLPLFENHPAVDGVLPIDTGKGYPADLPEVVRTVARIRRSGFDLAILFQNAFEAAFISFLGGIRLRVGYNTDGRGFLLTHPVARDPRVLQGHQVQYYLSILRAVGWEAGEREPRLHVPEKAQKAAQELLVSMGIREGDFLLGLAPGAAYGPAKRWPMERFAAVGDRAASAWGAKVVLLGTEAEKGLCEALGKAMTHAPIDLSNRTGLGEAMAMIRRCRLFVSNDSGLMHIAAALNVPTVAVFGSTDPAATGPRGRNARVVRRVVECSPCLRPECPTDFRCMLAVEPEDVWKEMNALMEEPG